MRATARKRVRRTIRRARWGNLRRLQPISAKFGFDRGTPVDRRYMEHFVAAHAEAIRGVVGEISEDLYSTRFGGERIERLEIIDIEAGPRATLVGDIAEEGVLPPETFDCLIVTQTLQYTRDPGLALRRCGAALRPGGTLLLAVPALTPHDDIEAAGDDYWRFWPAGVQALLTTAMPDAQVRLRSYGNLITVIAFLQGLCTEELSEEELAHHDPRFPVVVCARTDRSAAPGEGG